MPMLIWDFAGCTGQFVDLVMRWLVLRFVFVIKNGRVVISKCGPLLCWQAYIQTKHLAGDDIRMEALEGLLIYITSFF